MPNLDGTPTADEINDRRTEVFALINTHNVFLTAKEFVDLNDRDSQDVRRSLENMSSLILMEREIGAYEDQGQRARSLYMLSKSVSHLYFRPAPSQIDPLGLYRNYKRIEERSIWYDLDFLRIFLQFEGNPNLRITPQITKNILEHDLPKLLQVINAELGVDDTLKQRMREQYGNTKELPHIYNLVNFHRTKIALDKAISLINQATTSNFNLHNKKHRFAFCRLLIEIGECFTKKNLTDTAKKFFNPADLDALSSLRNSLTHFSNYLLKNNTIFDALRSPHFIDMIENIRNVDLPILRDITQDALNRTLTYDPAVSDNQFENHILTHFSFIKDTTLQEIKNKLRAISMPDNPNQALLSDDSINNLLISLNNKGTILNSDIESSNYRREIEEVIRGINPPLLGNSVIKRKLTEITRLVNHGIISFRSDPLLEHVAKLATSLNELQAQPDTITEAIANDRKLELIRTIEHILPTSYVFKELQNSFTDDIIQVNVGHITQYIELSNSRLSQDQIRSYKIAVLSGNDQAASNIISGINFSQLNPNIVTRDTNKYSAFSAMRNNIRTDLYTQKSLEFLLTGLQEIINDEVILNIDIRRQLRACRNSMAHHEPLFIGTDNTEFNLRYASIYIKEIKPLLQQLHIQQQTAP